MKKRTWQHLRHPLNLQLWALSINMGFVLAMATLFTTTWPVHVGVALVALFLFVLNFKRLITNAIKLIIDIKMFKDLE